MDVKKFDSLHRSDFDNGAILDEIRTALKQREGLLAALEGVRDAAKAPENRGAMTQLQMCRFLDGLLAGIESALAGARGIERSESND